MDFMKYSLLKAASYIYKELSSMSSSYIEYLGLIFQGEIEEEMKLLTLGDKILQLGIV